MKKLLIALVAIAIPSCAGTAYADMNVNIGTGDGRDVKPSIFASGKVEVRQPTLDELGSALAYPGVGADNMKFRARQQAQCRSDFRQADGSYGHHIATVFRSFEWGPNNIDVSGVREYREVSQSSVVGSQIEPVALNSIVCDNRHGAIPLQTCGTGLTRAVTNSLTRTSESTQAYTASQSVNYRVGSSASPAGAGGETRFSWTGSWGQSTGTTSSETITASASANVTVPPGQISRLVLNVEKGVATYEVDYAANFAGPVVVTCGDGRKAETTIGQLYSGGIPHLPNGRCPWCSGHVALYRPALSEHITVTNYVNARVTQESGE